MKPMGTPQTTAAEGALSAEELFRRHAPFVARFLFRLGLRPDGIEDALQEVFLVVHRQGGYRPGAAKPTSYLANLALYAASAHRRRERGRAARETDTAVEDVASGRSDPVQILETNESLRRLQSALERLDPDLRTTLVLVELEGETCASVAAAMGIPVGTVYWRLHQARKKFHRVLQAMEATRPARALALPAESFANGPRPERRDRVGMMVLLMTSPSGMSSEARDLLRLGGSRPPVGYAVEAGLARHVALVASATPAPSWANGLGSPAKGATWVAASATAIAAGAALVLFTRATPPTRSPESSPSRAPQALVATPVPTAPAAVARPAPAAPAAAGDEAPSSDPAVPVEALPLAPPPATASPIAPRIPPKNASPPAAPASAAPREESHDGDDDLLELQQVARAERLLGTDPGRALALARAAASHSAHGYVEEERSYVEIMALLGTGHLDEARPEVARFLRDHPESAFARRVREASVRARLAP
jgi:RNA polymerase sigma-70 factor (ECF subfamily)